MIKKDLIAALSHIGDDDEIKAFDSGYNTLMSIDEVGFQEGVHVIYISDLDENEDKEGD